MEPDLGHIVTLGLGLILGQLFKFIRKSLRWSKKRKAEATTNAESKSERARLIGAVVIASTIAFAALLVLVVSSQQASAIDRIITLLAAVAATLIFSTMLFLVFLQQMYTEIMGLKERSQLNDGRLLDLEAKVQTVPRKQPLLAGRKPTARAKAKPTAEQRDQTTSKRHRGKETKAKGEAAMNADERGTICSSSA